MAHGRQEFAFRHGRRFGRQFGAFQFHLEILVLLQLGAQIGDFLQMMQGLLFGVDAGIGAHAGSVPPGRDERDCKQ